MVINKVFFPPTVWKTGAVHIRMTLMCVFPLHIYRVSDDCASYLEGKRSPLSGSLHSSQSDPEPVERFALCFRDDM